MLKSSALFFAMFFLGAFSYAQTYQLSGQVVDERGNPVPFASIYKKNTATGTSANSEGVFRLPLRSGVHDLLIRAVGYRQASIQVTMNQHQSLTVTLQKESYMLEEVVIGNGEDPAYAIIRKTIRERRKHLTAANPYTAKVYIKGLQRMLRAPKKFFGVDLDEVGREIGLDSNRTGIVYLSESESRITVSPPKDFHEEMISSKLSGNNRAFSFNRAADLKLNFYENLQPIFDGLSPRPFVSPIADNALSYYRYQLLGTTDEEGLTIHKIRVTPRRKAEPVYAGDLYIIDGAWRIYGVNLYVTKESSINFLDSLHIRQEFIPLSADEWQPSSIRFDFVGGVLGFRLGGYFAAVYSDYVLNPQIERNLFNETLRIVEGVNKRDSAYWATHRPLVLTEEEQVDYVRKDSLRRKRESKEYLDSLDRKSNRFKPLGVFTTGYVQRNRAKRTTLAFDGLATSLLFNTVEGVALNYGVRYTKQLDSLRDRRLIVYGNARYGFSSERFNGYLGLSLPLGEGTIDLSGGSHVHDLNGRGSLPSFFNTISTLLYGRNYLKLYERTFGQIAWNYTLPMNMKVAATAVWENRRGLLNRNEYTFWDRNQPYLTSNNPFSPEQDVPVFSENQALRFSLGISYDFGFRYETYPHRRVYLPSKWPTLSVNYTKGIPKVLASDVDYDLLEVRLAKSDVSLGLYGRLSFDLRGGTFLNDTHLFYTDSYHIRGGQTLINDQQLSTFLLLDYYRHSTQGSFMEAHGEYNLATLLTSRIPLIRKLRLQEIIGLHFLKTSEVTHYAEAHAGLQWMGVRVLYVRSFAGTPNLRNKEAVRIGLQVPF